MSLGSMASPRHEPPAAAPVPSRRAARDHGPRQEKPTRILCLNTWRRVVWTNGLIAHLLEAYTGSQGVGWCAARELVTMTSPVPRSIMYVSTSRTFFITTLTLRLSMRSISPALASARVAPDATSRRLEWKYVELSG